MQDNFPEVLCRLESFSYCLPEELIAQNPSDVRDSSRLMHVSRSSGDIAHRRFDELPQLLRSGDLLVLNDTRVFRARLTGKKMSGSADVEIFCLSPSVDPAVWKALVRPGRKLQPGAKVCLDGGYVAEIGDRIEDGLRLVHFPGDVPPGEIFSRCGQVPLPPYIKNSTASPERYQTVYANSDNDRSVAAPTAGLHFTQNLLGSLEQAGIGHTFITLDVGVGTFRPVKVDDVRDHHMHSERCRISDETAARIRNVKESGGRVVAVGTTVVRTLESFVDERGRLAGGERETDIFIRPGYRFRVIDALITNFHLPKSTLLMLVSAFAGYERTMSAYEEAVRERYRFFSFGDAMLIE